MAEKCTKEYTETPAYDLINRHAAIDLVRDVCNAVMSGCESWYDPETEDEVYKDIREVDAILKCNKEVRIALQNMPSEQPKGDICKKGDKGMHIYNQDKAEVTIELTGSEFHKFIEDARNGGINDAWELAKKWAKLNKSLNMSAEDAFLEAEREEETEELLVAVEELKDQLSKLERRANKLKGQLENQLKNHASLWG